MFRTKEQDFSYKGDDYKYLKTGVKRGGIPTRAGVRTGRFDSFLDRFLERDTAFEFTEELLPSPMARASVPRYGEGGSELVVTEDAILKHPREFEMYIITFELCDSNRQTIQWLSFPILPSSITKIEPVSTNIIKTFGGIIVTKTDEFIPQSITLSGNFGRGFIDMDKKFFYGIRRSGRYPLEINEPNTPFHSTVKTGFGVMKELQKLLKYSRKQINYKPNILYFHNNTFSESYMCEVRSVRFFQTLETNMIWNYEIELDIVDVVAYNMEFVKDLKRKAIRREVTTANQFHEIKKIRGIFNKIEDKMMKASTAVAETTGTINSVINTSFGILSIPAQTLSNSVNSVDSMYKNMLGVADNIIVSTANLADYYCYALDRTRNLLVSVFTAKDWFAFGRKTKHLYQYTISQYKAINWKSGGNCLVFQNYESFEEANTWKNKANIVDKYEYNPDDRGNATVVENYVTAESRYPDVPIPPSYEDPNIDWSNSDIPRIFGDEFLFLEEGYSFASTNPYIIAGKEPVTVTKERGDAKITWNDTTKRLDIASGLAKGDYVSVLKLDNGNRPIVHDPQTGTNIPTDVIFVFTVKVRKVKSLFTDEDLQKDKIINSPFWDEDEYSPLGEVKVYEPGNETEDKDYEHNIKIANLVSETDYNDNVTMPTTYEPLVDDDRNVIDLSSIYWEDGNVDDLSDEELYGRDIDDDFDFATVGELGVNVSENAEYIDFKILSPKQTFVQTAKILSNLNKNDNPEYPHDGIDKKMFENRMTFYSYYQILKRNMANYILKDDTIREFEINKVYFEEDAVFMQIGFKSLLDKNDFTVMDFYKQDV
jgi:hypothetical protein